MFKFLKRFKKEISCDRCKHKKIGRFSGVVFCMATPAKPKFQKQGVKFRPIYTSTIGVPCWCPKKKTK